MADEKAKEQAEAPKEESAETPVEETKEESKNQPSEEEAPVSEDAETPSEPDRGDLRVALKEERTKRQLLEQSLQDPNFVYERAKELGLTEQEAQAAQDSIQTQPSQPDIYGTVEEILKYKEEVKNFPQSESNQAVAQMVNGLVQGGMKPAEAVKAAKKEFDKAVEDAQKAKTQEQETEASDQRNAQTAPSDTTTSSDAEELADLSKRAKSLDPRIQKEAQIEILKRRNAKDKIL